MKLPLDTTPLDDEQILLARSAGYRYVRGPGFRLKVAACRVVLRAYKRARRAGRESYTFWVLEPLFGMSQGL